MTKFAGITVTLNIDNNGGSPVNVSNDVSSIDFEIPIGEQVVTGLDMSAEERLQLLKDYKVSISGRGIPSSATRTAIWENTAGARTVTIDFPDSVTIAAEMLIFSVKGGRADDGAFTWSQDLALANGTAAAFS